jgi:hypothetical protein
MSTFLIGFLGGLAGGAVALIAGAPYLTMRLIAKLDQCRDEMLPHRITRADAWELL